MPRWNSTEAIVEADPHDAQSYMRIAEIYRRTGQVRQSLEALKKAEAEVQDSLEVPYNMAVIYQAQGKFDDAIAGPQSLLKKSEKPTASTRPASGTTARCSWNAGRASIAIPNKTQLAVDTFRQMVDLGDDNVTRGYQQIIDTYREAKEWKEATAVAQEAVDKLPQRPQPEAGARRAIGRIGQAEQALAQAKSMLKGTARRSRGLHRAGADVAA